MTDSQPNSAAVGQPALQALQLSRVQQILRDVRDGLIVDLEKHEEYKAGVCDACNDAIDAVTAEPGSAQQPSLLEQLAQHRCSIAGQPGEWIDWSIVAAVLAVKDTREQTKEDR